AWPIADFLARRPRGVRSPFLDSRARRCEPTPTWMDACRTFALSVTASTEFGSASMTVTGICCPASLKILVIPSFLPTIPILGSSHLVFDVHPRRQIQLRQRVDRLSAGIEDVDHPL